MALLKARPEDIPEGSIILSEDDAVKYEVKLLRNWKTKSDVWAFNYGGTVLASLSAMSAVYINNYYRARFKLFRQGQMASYLPVCIIPAIMSFAFHAEFVLPDIVLQKTCAVCTELRASALQAGIACVFPSIFAPVAASALAVRYGTYNVPYLLQEPLKAFHLWKKQTKPIGNILFGIFVAQALAGSVITYFEAQNIEKVHDKLILLGYELENETELN